MFYILAVAILVFLKNQKSHNKTELSTTDQTYMVDQIVTIKCNDLKPHSGGFLDIKPFQRKSKLDKAVVEQRT